MTSRRGTRVPFGLLALAAAGGGWCVAVAGEHPTFVGPAMGTTYRVVLAAPLEHHATGEVHREIEAVLARIDRAASTWRHDSDASRFNRAAADEWLDVADDLVDMVEIARRVHAASQGAFDVTVATRADGSAATAPAVSRPGMPSIETRPAVAGRPAAIRKTRAGVAIDLGGIGPGYAVDRIGARLAMLGSRAHLVELGGEVRGWGRAAGGGAWRVRVTGGGAAGPRVIELADGAAVAASTLRPGRSPLDPRTGRPVAGEARTLLGWADPGDSPDACAFPDACAWADAWAVAAIVLGLAADADGVVRVPPAPSTPAARPAATRAIP